jgi:hypothetical protein
VPDRVERAAAGAHERRRDARTPGTAAAMSCVALPIPGIDSIPGRTRPCGHPVRRTCEQTDFAAAI